MPHQTGVHHRRPGFALFLGLFLLLAPSAQVAAALAVAEGEKLYNETCAMCHEAGVTKAPSRHMLGFIAPGSFYRALTKGIMRGQAAGLDEKQKIAVSRYLTGREPEARSHVWSAPACKGDAASGERIWKTYTIAEQPAARKPNRQRVMQYGPSGAPVWNTPAIDARRRQLYVGTGENYSSPAGPTSDAILAFRLDDGKMLWSFQATAGDAWNSSCVLEDRSNCPAEDGPDFDFGGATILAHSNKGRELVLAGQKSGIVWALDPDDGSLVWKQQVGRGGALEGGAAALLDGGMLFVNSGYMFNQHMPGNVLLAFRVQPRSPAAP